MQSSRSASIAGIAKRTNVRYLILLMIFIITTLNYADRATLSITGSAMRSEFGFDAIRMGYIFSAFSWAYVLSQLPAGWLLDRFGARRMYAASIFLWSLFTLLQSSIGLAGSAGAAVIALFVLRFAMGMAEAPAFPANAKVVVSWFPTAGARHRLGHFQFGPVFRCGYLHAAHGLDHPFVRMAKRLSGNGCRRDCACPDVAQGHEEPERSPSCQQGRTRAHRERRRPGSSAKKDCLCQCGQPGNLVLCAPVDVEPHAPWRVPGPVLHQRPDLFLPDVVSDLPRPGPWHDHPASRTHCLIARYMRFYRWRARRGLFRRADPARSFPDDCAASPDRWRHAFYPYGIIGCNYVTAQTGLSSRSCRWLSLEKVLARSAGRWSRTHHPRR